MDDLTAFRRDLLYVIARLDEPPGVAIKDELEEYYRSEIAPGQLYPNLDALVEKKLISKGQHDLRTNAYELTERGRRKVETHQKWITGNFSKD